MRVRGQGPPQVEPPEGMEKDREEAEERANDDYKVSVGTVGLDIE